MTFQESQSKWLKLSSLAKVLLPVLLLYVFLVSISLMGAGLKLLGLEFTQRIIASTSNAFVGLFIGILVTSIVQSSSTTTSITVGLVGSGMMSLEQAIPIVMGANIGTSVTNILVSLGHLRIKPELQRAFGAAVVHDTFNVLSVIVIFPLQLSFNILGRSSNFLAQLFEKSGGLEIVSPLKIIVSPSVNLLESLLGKNGWLVLALALLLLFLALKYIVVVMKSLVLRRLSVFFDKVIFRTPLVGLFFGMVFTAIVQSSSVTTSLVIPLAGAGLVSLTQIFPYTLGANIGTTITALLASLVTQNQAAVAVAFAHLIFNIFGICIFLPLKMVPIFIANKLAVLSVKNRYFPIAFVLFVFLIIPLLLIQITR
ncbi:MAG: Na/Pi cotransporter family protein [candidate division Zixibacteria bacterium]|nr:Na/Pi cotransporter family protein [Candidatus Tariuqbacter arcticus]